MEPRSKKAHRSPEEMLEILSTWKSSGLSRQAFCKEHQLPYSVFQYWNRKFNEENKQVESSFIELSNTPSSLPELEILFPSGVKIVLSGKTDPDFIRSLVK